MGYSEIQVILKHEYEAIMANILGFVGVGLSVVVLLCDILALSLKYWAIENGSGYTANIGLWGYCTKADATGDKECTGYKRDESTDEKWRSIEATRAMIFLGIFGALAAVVLGILVIFILRSTKILYFAAGGLDVIAGVFTMMEIAIYVDKLKDDDHELHVAFALAVIGWLVAWIAGGIFIGAKIKDNDVISPLK